ncbi:MAG TPA: hypothetical protein VHE30_13805 [Polyangiaceae bacterium]|nr:hypothetical protein [Polyangiaceae bacterium]
MAVAMGTGHSGSGGSTDTRGGSGVREGEADGGNCGAAIDANYSYRAWTARAGGTIFRRP